MTHYLNNEKMSRRDSDGHPDLFNLPYLKETEELIELGWQFRLSRVLLTAFRLGVFKALKKQRKLEDLAQRLKVNEAVLRKLVYVICSIGLVDCRNEGYELSDIGRAILLPESQRYIGPVLRRNEKLWWIWTGLPDLIQSGRWPEDLKQLEDFKPDNHEDFIRSMHAIAANGSAQWLANNVDLSGRRNMLDLGGGPGTFSIALCQRYPESKAAVYDLPQTLPMTLENIDYYGLAPRIKPRPGDWDKEKSLGSGYDVVLLSNILHGPDSRAEMKLSKAFDCLEIGGLIIVHDFMMYDDCCGPLGAVLFNLHLSAFTFTEIKDKINLAGFIDAEVVAVSKSRGDTIIIAKKSY